MAESTRKDVNFRQGTFSIGTERRGVKTGAGGRVIYSPLLKVRDLKKGYEWGAAQRRYAFKKAWQDHTPLRISLICDSRRGGGAKEQLAGQVNQ